MAFRSPRASRARTSQSPIPNPQAKPWQVEVGGWKLGVGSWRLEVGRWKLGVGSWALFLLCFPSPLHALHSPYGYLRGGRHGIHEMRARGLQLPGRAGRAVREVLQRALQGRREDDGAALWLPAPRLSIGARERDGSPGEQGSSGHHRQRAETAGAFPFSFSDIVFDMRRSRLSHPVIVLYTLRDTS